VLASIPVSELDDFARAKFYGPPEAAETNEKWGVEVGIADKKWGSNAA